MDYPPSATVMVRTAVYKADIGQGRNQTERATMHLSDGTMVALIDFITLSVRTNRIAIPTDSNTLSDRTKTCHVP